MIRIVIAALSIFMLPGCNRNDNKNFHITYYDNGRIKQISVPVTDSQTQEISFYENGAVAGISNFNNGLKNESQVSLSKKGQVFLIEDADTANGGYYSRQLFVFDDNGLVNPQLSNFVIAEKDSVLNKLNIYYMSGYNEVCMVDSILSNQRTWKCGLTIRNVTDSARFIKPIHIPVSNSGYYYFSSDNSGFLLKL